MVCTPFFMPNDSEILLSSAEHRAIAVAVVNELFLRGMLPPRPDPVLTFAEAMALARKRSADAFYSWDKKFGPTSCGHGRYSRERIERALDRESRR